MTVRHDVSLLQILGRPEGDVDEKPASTERSTGFGVFTLRVNVDGVVDEGIGYSWHHGTPGARSLARHTSTKSGLRT
ncbi:MAG: hypothetical protein ACYCOX_07385 [Acidobacteriaceae bacterium]